MKVTGRSRSDASEVLQRLLPAIMTFIICTLLCIASYGCTTNKSTAANDASICTYASSAETEPSASEQAANPSNDNHVRGLGPTSDIFFDEFSSTYEELEGHILEELENRRSLHPTHFPIGEEVKVTGDLAVSVISVEPGLFDYRDDGPTVKTTVAMRNLSYKALWVKASNWNADNTNSQRVGHKLWVFDEHGKRVARSFTPTRISPYGAFVGDTYFGGEALNSVIYEPHWLTSSQSQYIYFDL